MGTVWLFRGLVESWDHFPIAHVPSANRIPCTVMCVWTPPLSFSANRIVALIQFFFGKRSTYSKKKYLAREVHVH